MILAKLVYVILIGYFLGSIPWGVIISQRFSQVDVRQYGSGKTGTTNVLRTAGGKSAAIVVFLDLFKGGLAVILSGIIFGHNLIVVGEFGLGTLIAQVLGALAAIAGHNWSIFLKFRGGRGVATYFGGLAVLCPPVAIISGEVMIVSAGFTRYASLGSILGIVSTYVILIPLIILQNFPMEYLVYALIGGLVIIAMHRDNIWRLITGTEHKIGQRGQKIEPHTS